MTRLLIALDVDGTIVRHDRVTISPRVWAAVRAVHLRGDHVVLATGRSPASTVPVTAELGLTGGFVVCSNGAVTLRLDATAPDRYTVVAEAAFDPRAVLALLGRAWPGCAVALEIPGARGFRVAGPFPRDAVPDEVSVVLWDELAATSASRLLIYAAGNPASTARVVGDLGLECVEDATATPGVVEIGLRGVSKASSLESLRTALGVAEADTVAVGDHVNDVEMLRWAARGIAMGNAPAAVREAAAEVVPSCDDDGLADVLDALACAVTMPARHVTVPEPRYTARSFQ